MVLTKDKRQQLDPDIAEYIQHLEDSTADWEQQHTQLQIRYEHLQEELRLALHRQFSRSSEQAPREQTELFGEAEQYSVNDEKIDADPAETITIREYEKAKPGRKPIDPKVPRIDIEHDIDEADKQCACGCTMERIGEEVTERLQTIPEQVYAERHIRPKYACKNCEGSGDEDRPAVRIAPTPPSIIPGSIVTPGLLAFILMNKFVDHLPFYRQEQRFARIGVHISRQDMSNWTIRSAKRIAPLIERYRQLIREGPVVQMDETRMLVRNEPGRTETATSWMWLARGGPSHAPVTLYDYHTSRGTAHPMELLHGYSGYLQTDGYEVYQRIARDYPAISLVGCWAHARRKFHDAAAASKKKTGAAHEGMKHIESLYRIERALRDEDLKPQKFVDTRREQVEPVLAKFKSWLEKKVGSLPPQSTLGKAVNYTLNQWEYLVRYLDLAELTPDNNATERAIRPFVMGRKNWLASGAPHGAESSCAMYSLIETSRQNGLNPYAYLHHVFHKVPMITSDEQWDELLPHNLDIETINSAFLATVR